MLLEYSREDQKELNLRKGLAVDDVFPGGEMLVYIKSGLLEVHVSSGALVNLLSEGQMYGISNLFCEDELQSRLRAKTDCTLILIHKEKAREIMEKRQELYRAYCTMMNGKIGFLLSHISLLSIKSNRKRLAAFLLEEDAKMFSSREELADYLAMGRSALFRELSYLTEKGAIEYGNQKIEIIDKNILLEVLNA